MNCSQTKLVILTILMCCAGRAWATSIYIDFGDRANPVDRITEGLISVQFTTPNGAPRSTGNLFGIDGQGPSDAAALIDGGNGVAEQLHFVFNRFVYILAITISEFGALDAGTFEIDGKVLTLRNGNTIYGTPLRAVGGVVNKISWTGENLSGSDRGFSIDGMIVRLGNNADFDEDLDVDGEDFLIWQRGFKIGSSHSLGDANYDGVVSQSDLIHTWKPQFGITYPPPVQLIPEPSASTLVTCAGLLTGIAKSRIGSSSSRRLRRPQG